MPHKHSGKFVLRLSPKYHQQLKALAQKRGISLNQLCIERLMAPVNPEFSTWIELIHKTFGGEHLHAILIYGSQARGEASSSSDLDLLVVLTGPTRPSRHLYEIWDDKVAPHLPEHISPSFVRCPTEDDSSASGLWLEIAMDGIMIWQSNTAMQNYLQRLRSEIAVGVYARKYIHGQPFWSKAKHGDRDATLAKDYIKRCKARLLAIDCLYDQESWADVVRESQEVVELALKACLRHFNIEAPRIHDVSALLESEADHLPSELKKEIPKLVQISKSLRRDRELAFYGFEDLTPSEFYARQDADTARTSAQFVVKCVSSAML